MKPEIREAKNTYLPNPVGPGRIREAGQNGSRIRAGLGPDPVGIHPDLSRIREAIPEYSIWQARIREDLISCHDAN